MCTNGGAVPSSYMVEINQLKEDNKRLMNMLRETKEYKEFAGYVDDCGGNVRNTTQT
jgi:predicted TIM-barrel fold metal-dependent hydrolase